MYTSALASQLRSAATVHARLLDSFIELTLAEIDRQSCAFTRESLNESLQMMREDRRSYGVVGGLALVSDAA